MGTTESKYQRKRSKSLLKTPNLIPKQAKKLKTSTHLYDMIGIDVLKKLHNSEIISSPNSESEENKIQEKLIRKHKGSLIDLIQQPKIISEMFENEEEEAEKFIEKSITSNILENYDYYSKNDELRKSYIFKLIHLKLWNPGKRVIRYNCLVFFDWDDTILPTYFLTRKNKYLDDVQLTLWEINQIKKLEEYAIRLLTIAISKGSTYIVTNAVGGWVEYSSHKFFPNLFKILRNVKIISARDRYSPMFPNNSKIWKVKVFQDIRTKFNNEVITNIVSIGDSDNEIIAANHMASQIELSVVKTVKFKSNPTIDELVRQLKYCRDNFENIMAYAENYNLLLNLQKTKAQKLSMVR